MAAAGWAAPANWTRAHFATLPFLVLSTVDGSLAPPVLIILPFEKQKASFGLGFSLSLSSLFLAFCVCVCRASFPGGPASSRDRCWVALRRSRRKISESVGTAPARLALSLSISLDSGLNWLVGWRSLQSNGWDALAGEEKKKSKRAKDNRCWDYDGAGGGV